MAEQQTGQSKAPRMKIEVAQAAEVPTTAPSSAPAPRVEPTPRVESAPTPAPTPAPSATNTQTAPRSEPRQAPKPKMVVTPTPVEEEPEVEESMVAQSVPEPKNAPAPEYAPAAGYAPAQEYVPQNDPTPQPQQQASSAEPKQKRTVADVRDGATSWVKRTFPGHEHAFYGAVTALFLALLVFAIGIVRVLFICVLVVLGIAVGQVLDGDPKIIRAVQELFSSERERH